jgi:hypothetical protein
VTQNPLGINEVVITEKGNTLCYEVISGRYFRSDIEKLRKEVNDLNKTILHEDYISLNDFYYGIGLKGTKQGEELGWSVNDGLIDLQFSSTLAEDGTPCLVLDYRPAPRYDYRRR